MSTNADIIEERREHARRFAAAFIAGDEWSEWEDRKWTVYDLWKIAETLERMDRWKSPWASDLLPDLGPKAFQWNSEEQG